MNKSRRQKLSEANKFIEMAENIIEYIKDEEQECLDNMPENLQYSERCEYMEQVVDVLEDVLSEIDSVKTTISNVIE